MVTAERKRPLRWNECSGLRGADGNRNHDLFDANEALYQLSYSPVDVAVLCIATRYSLLTSVNKRKSTARTTPFRVSRRGDMRAFRTHISMYFDKIAPTMEHIVETR